MFLAALSLLYIRYQRTSFRISIGAINECWVVEMAPDLSEVAAQLGLDLAEQVGRVYGQSIGEFSQR